MEAKKSREDWEQARGTESIHLVIENVCHQCGESLQQKWPAGMLAAKPLVRSYNFVLSCSACGAKVPTPIDVTAFLPCDREGFVDLFMDIQLDEEMFQSGRDQMIEEAATDRSVIVRTETGYAVVGPASAPTLRALEQRSFRMMDFETQEAFLDFAAKTGWQLAKDDQGHVVVVSHGPFELRASPEAGDQGAG